MPDYILHLIVAHIRKLGLKQSSKCGEKAYSLILLIAANIAKIFGLLLMNLMPVFLNRVVAIYWEREDRIIFLDSLLVFFFASNALRHLQAQAVWHRELNINPEQS